MAAHFDLLNKPLAKEIAVILVLKLVLLLGIRALWFGAPDTITDDSVKVGQHLLGSVADSPEKFQK